MLFRSLERTTLKLLYGQAFRAPTIYELYADGGGSEPNPHLKPETVKTSEIVIEQSLPKSLRMTVSGYYYPIRGLISLGDGTAPGLLIYRNSNNIDMKGLELALQKKFSSGLETGGSFSIQTAHDVATGSHLVNSPRHLGQAHLSVPLFHRQMFASMNVQYVGRRCTLAGNYVGAYVVPNLTLFSQKALKGWEASVTLYNFFDKRFGDPGGEEHQQDVVYQDGRTFRVKFGYRF